jgi:hypothetical protein
MSKRETYVTDDCMIQIYTIQIFKLNLLHENVYNDK